MTTSADKGSQDRPIEDLIKLKTFQGMSDSEITNIVTYTASVAASQAASNALAQAQSQENLAKANYYNEKAKAISDEIKNMITPLTLKQVAADDSNE